MWLSSLHCRILIVTTISCVSVTDATLKSYLTVIFCSQAAFQKTAETFGGIDIVCNNAGILNECEWEKTVSINLVRRSKNNKLHLVVIMPHYV